MSSDMSVVECMKSLWHGIEVLLGFTVISASNIKFLHFKHLHVCTHLLIALHVGSL